MSVLPAADQPRRYPARGSAICVPLHPGHHPAHHPDRYPAGNTRGTSRYAGPVNPSEFAAKWRGRTLNERTGQPGALHRPLPHARRADAERGRPDRRRATPSRRAPRRSAGGDGFADVWKRGHFAWEYKGKHKDLDGRLPAAPAVPRGAGEPAAAGRLRPRPLRGPHQLHEHRQAASTPSPRRPARATRRSRCASCARVMEHPEQLRPGNDPRRADRRGRRASSPPWPSGLRDRGHEPHEVAHFLDKLLFCMFAEDAGLLPDGLFARLAERGRRRPGDLHRRPRATCSRRWPTRAALFGAERIDWFNGGLFDGARRAAARRPTRSSWSTQVVSARLVAGRAGHLRHALRARPRPEQALPARRPLHRPGVIMRLDRAGADGAAAPRPRGDARRRSRRCSARGQARSRRARRPDKNPRAVFNALPRPAARRARARPGLRLGQLPLLALQALKDLEREAILWASLDAAGADAVPGGRARRRCTASSSTPTPPSSPGWSSGSARSSGCSRNGFAYPRDPILRPLDNIECRDAVLDLSDPEHPREPDWPDGDGHHRQPAVPGREAAAARTSATTTSTRCSSVYDGRVPARGRLRLLLAREGPGDGRGGRRSSASGCSRRRASAAARTAGCSSGSRRPATSSWPGRTSRGFSRARPFTSRSSASTTAPSRSARSTVSRSQRSTPT